MFQQIAVGGVLVGMTVLIQAGFTAIGLLVLDRLRERKKDFAHHHAMGVIVFFVLLMFVAVILNVWVWASFYYFTGTIKEFEEALYFSSTTFTTLGYGDIVLSKEWRLLSSFEAANGLIIFGWAAAFVVASIQHFYVWHDKKR